MILRSIVFGAATLGFAAAALANGIGVKPDDGTAAKSTQPGSKRAVPSAPSAECCEPYRYVYAGSWYGGMKVVAPVRRTPLGDEVQIPGGIWVACEFSCEYILRKQTLHYWEDQGAGTGSQMSPSYPRQDWYVDGWGYRHGYLF